MKIPNPTGLISLGKAFIQANRPELLLGASIVSTVSGVILAARGGYKSGQQVLQQEIDTKTEMTTREKAKLTWINYLPAAGLTASALGSTTGLHYVHVKEKKQLAAMALMAIEEVRSEAKAYTAELMETVEENSTEKAKEKIQKAVEEKGLSDQDGCVIEEHYLIRDLWSGRDIWSNKQKIEDAVNEINNIINASGDVDLNSFYEYAGFPPIDEGNAQGWQGVFLELVWGSTTRSDGRPVTTFKFRSTPSRGFDSTH